MPIVPFLPKVVTRGARESSPLLTICRIMRRKLFQMDIGFCRKEMDLPSPPERGGRRRKVTCSKESRERERERPPPPSFLTCQTFLPHRPFSASKWKDQRRRRNFSQILVHKLALTQRDGHGGGCPRSKFAPERGQHLPVAMWERGDNFCLGLRLCADQWPVL